MTRILCCHMMERRAINVYRPGKNGKREKQFNTLKRNKEIEYNKTIYWEWCCCGEGTEWECDQKFRVQPIFYNTLNVNVNKEFSPIFFYSILSCPNII